MEKLKEKIPDIKSKYELNMEQQNFEDSNNIQNNKNESDETPIKDWWGDIFKK